MPSRPAGDCTHDPRVEIRPFSRAACPETIVRLFTPADGETVTPLRGDCPGTVAAYLALLAAARIVTCAGHDRAVAITQLIGSVARVPGPCQPEEREAWRARTMADLDEILGRHRVLAAVLRERDGALAIEALVRPIDDALHARWDWFPRLQYGSKPAFKPRTCEDCTRTPRSDRHADRPNSSHRAPLWIRLSDLHAATSITAAPADSRPTVKRRPSHLLRSALLVSVRSPSPPTQDGPAENVECTPHATQQDAHVETMPTMEIGSATSITGRSAMPGGSRVFTTTDDVTEVSRHPVRGGGPTTHLASDRTPAYGVGSHHLDRGPALVGHRPAVGTQVHRASAENLATRRPMTTVPPPRSRRSVLYAGDQVETLTGAVARRERYQLHVRALAPQLEGSELAGRVGRSHVTGTEGTTRELLPADAYGSRGLWVRSDGPDDPTAATAFGMGREPILRRRSVRDVEIDVMRLERSHAGEIQLPRQHDLAYQGRREAEGAERAGFPRSGTSARTPPWDARARRHIRMTSSCRARPPPP